MYSLSTAWNSSKHNNGYDLVREIKAIGFDTIELSCALPEKIVNDILALKESFEIEVSSLHNMCPLPKDIGIDEASPDYYSLASPDEKERRLAMEVAKNTIDHAKRFGARAVVLHSGRVQIKDRTRDLEGVFADKQKFAILKADMIKERAQKKNGYLDNLIKSLGELIGHAEKTGIYIGIENRFYYREIPSIEELEAIFTAFKSNYMGYWHDVGHGEVFERLGLCRHKDYLDKFAHRLIGVHLHDIIGLTDDHQAPGHGTFDFELIKPYIRKDTIKVIESHQPATAADIRHGLEYLTKILG
jgi:sugar phosphate isomerase/epimerase